MKNDVTIAICTYNSEKYITETLTRVIGQTFQHFDLLIINDCSTDHTRKVIDGFFSRYPRDYRLINLPVNGGIANARQIALEQSESKYLLFIDSDDLPHPDLLEKEYQLISSDEKIMAVSCWSEYVDMSGKKLKGGLFLGAKTKEEFLSLASREKLIFFPIQTLFNRMEALRVGGFRLSGFPEGGCRYQDYCEDLDLWTRISDLYTEGKYMISIPEVLYSYRKGNTGLSSNTVNMLLKIKYVKENLKLRRAGKPELDFTDFMKSIPKKEMKRMIREAKGVDHLRNGVFLLLKWRILSGLYHITKAVFLNPKYFIQKLKVNSGVFKK